MSVKMRNKSGFTLIELLVVIAIIAILAAILFPIFARAKASARKANCVSNLQQIAKALILYADDQKGRLPDFHADPASAAREDDFAYWHERFCRGRLLNPGQISFADALQPYLRSYMVTFCPADSLKEQGKRLVTSYEYKAWLATGRKLSAINAPSNMAMVWEQWDYHSSAPHGDEDERRSWMNIAFVDGHVRWVSLADSTTAIYGDGPDLHWFFKENEPDHPHFGRDFR